MDDTHLIELLVVLPDTAEAPWSHEADDLIEAGPQTLAGVQSCHRRRKDERPGSAVAKNAGSDSSGRSRGHTIVDDDGHPAGHIKRTGRRPKLDHNLLDLLETLANQDIQLVRPHPAGCDHVIIEHNRAAFTHGAQGQFGLPRHADLANDEHIQRNTQGIRHQCCNGHTAPRQAQNQAALDPRWDGRACEPTGDHLSQVAPSIGPVPEHPLSLHLSDPSCRR